MKVKDKVFHRLSITDYYSLFYTFLVSGLFGWVYEIVTVYICHGIITTRGLIFVYSSIGYYIPFLNPVPIINRIYLFWGLPIIVVYGIGGCLISTIIKKNRSYVYVFFIGMMLLTVFEFLSSCFCEYALHMILWDYSKEVLNFQGRICLRASLAWGIISIIGIRILVPAGFHIYMKERKLDHYKMLSNVLIVYTVLCIIYRYFFWKK